MTTHQAIQYFGTIPKLAAVLGIRPEAIYQWGQYPPTLRQYQIAEASEGKLSITRKKEAA